MNMLRYSSILLLIVLNCCFFDAGAQIKNGGGVTDIDGNTYKTVTIGGREWMAENLKTTKLNDREEIPNITDNAKWRALKTPAYCWYDNDISKKDSHGALYNWHTVSTKKICPKGWHVPSDNEWSQLVEFLGGDKVAGGKMKEIGTEYWLTPNEGATNESGISGRAYGTRGFRTGPFLQLGYYADWWTSTEYLGGTAWQRRLHFNNTTVTRNASDKRVDYAIRCIKDK